MSRWWYEVDGRRGKVGLRMAARGAVVALVGRGGERPGAETSVSSERLKSTPLSVPQSMEFLRRPFLHVPSGLTAARRCR